MCISEKQFKSCLGAFATGVTVITTLDKLEQIHGITVNSFNSVSLNPPMILFSIEKKAVRFDIFTSCSNFIVNILSDQQKTISKMFAARDINWDKIKYKTEYDMPVLEGVLSYLYCSKKYEYDGGDHKIIVGEVIKAQKIKDNNKSLLYYEGCYYTVGKLL